MDTFSIVGDPLYRMSPDPETEVLNVPSQYTDTSPDPEMEASHTLAFPFNSRSPDPAMLLSILLAATSRFISPEPAMDSSKFSLVIVVFPST